MGDDASSENVRLEVQEGASATGEAVWKDAGPISLLDSLQSHQQSPPATSCPTSTQTTPLPKQAKEWLLSKHSIKMKKDRQNLYLFRNAPDNGVNTNLLILLHGSGDSHRPFDKLAQTMSLPQTATLSISSMVCGIELPFGLGSSWFQELDYSSGNPLPRANANRQTTLGVAVAYLTELLRRLSTYCWAPERIFILGYGAGAILALETCRLWTGPPLGGAICIGMDGLGGTVTGSATSNSGTPILLLSHDKNLLDACKSEYEARRGKDLVETCAQAKRGMVSGPSEMEAVMKFLSKRLVLGMQMPSQASLAT